MIKVIISLVIILIGFGGLFDILFSDVFSRKKTTKSNNLKINSTQIDDKEAIKLYRRELKFQSTSVKNKTELKEIVLKYYQNKETNK